jgi:hypothetical protein
MRHAPNRPIEQSRWSSRRERTSGRRESILVNLSMRELKAYRMKAISGILVRFYGSTWCGAAVGLRRRMTAFRFSPPTSDGSMASA